MIKVIHDTKYENLINWLVSIRKDRGLTVRDVGALIGEHHQLVSRIETLQRKLNVYEYIQYCDALEINSDEGLNLLKKNISEESVGRTFKS